MCTVENNVCDKIKTVYFFSLDWRQKKIYAYGFVVSSMKFLIHMSCKKYQKNSFRIPFLRGVMLHHWAKNTKFTRQRCLCLMTCSLCSMSRSSYSHGFQFRLILGLWYIPLYSVFIANSHTLEDQFYVSLSYILTSKIHRCVSRPIKQGSQ